MATIKIVVIDDHPYILRAIRDILRSTPDMEIVAEGGTGEDVFALTQLHSPDVLILDQTMPESSSDTNQRFKPMPAISKVRREFPDVKIVILSAHSHPVMIQTARREGVAGYISKSDAEVDFADAIRVVMSDCIYLSESVRKAMIEWNELGITERQVEVLAAINDNPTVSYEELAADLGMAESTFKKHLTDVMKRLGVPGNKLAAIKLAENLGLF